MKHNTTKPSKKSDRGNVVKYTTSLPKQHPHCAGIDLGAREHWVAVPPDHSETPVRSFGCCTPDLQAMGAWLRECGITSVAMESTGVYWVPVFQILETFGLEVKLVDAHHVKNVSGRKSDVSDCQWLQQLHSVGLLAAAFRPEDSICVLRSYCRHRESLVQGCAQQIHHMQKALEQMNLQLHKVISDISGVTGFKIIRAIVAGERDPQVLAQHRHPNIKCSTEKIMDALTGDYRPEHVFALQQAVELYDIFQCKVQQCDEQIQAHLSTFERKAQAGSIPAHRNKTKGKRRKNEPYFDLRKSLYEVAGVDLTQIDGIDALTAQVILSECGHDMSPFPTEKHFASWLGLCPNNRKTGGKIRSRHTRHVQNRIANALRVAAHSLHHSKSALGAFYRRMKGRLGPAKAIMATAHKLACQIYRMLKFGQEYHDIGAQAYEERFLEKRRRALINNAKDLGYDLVDGKTGELVS